MKICERVEALRSLMKEKGMDAYVVPSFDSHQSEYVAEHFKCRQWISGFTGSAGTVVITQDDAGLWTDGRYYIQAENQLKESGIRLFKAAEIGVPSYTEWLKGVLKDGQCVGFDGYVFSVKTVNDMKEAFKDKNIILEHNYNLIDLLWKDRPELSKASIFDHDTKFAGASRKDKLDVVRQKIKEAGAENYILASLDDIAWLLNLRGADVPNNPVFLSYVIVTGKECYLFTDTMKIGLDLQNELKNDGITVKAYNDIKKCLQEMQGNQSIIMDYNRINYTLYSAIDENKKKINSTDITTKLKAVKNDIEVENLKQCQVNDGVALVKLIKWLKESIGTEMLTEISVDEKLLSFRKEGEHFVGLSFDSIIGYKANAAMMHYKALAGKEATLENEGLLLIDSGGQYYNFL